MGCIVSIYFFPSDREKQIHFVCESGESIPLTGFCDKHSDCKDKSDENCG